MTSICIINLVSTKTPFNILELVIAICLLGALVAAAIYAFDPEERAKKDRDELQKENAKEVLAGISRYYEKSGKLPWGTDALPWTSSRDISVGICADHECGTPGVLISEEALNRSMLSEEFTKSEDPKDWIFVGRGEKAENQVYACFVPNSRAGRVDPIALYSLVPGEVFPEGERPKFCQKSPDWANNFCYSCVSQKLGMPVQKKEDVRTYSTPNVE